MVTPRVESAVAVVDQAFGAIRLVGGEVAAGMDLAAGVGAAVDALRSARVRLALAVPRRGEGGFARTAPRGLPFEAAAFAVGGAPSDWLAALTAGLDSRPEATIFAAADLTWRTAAHAQGHPVAPHAAVAWWLARGREPRFVRVEGPREVVAGEGDLLPYHREPGPRGEAVWGALPADAIAPLAARGATVEVVRLDPGLCDPCLFRLDGRRGQALRELGAHDIVWSDGRLALLAVRHAGADALERLGARHGAVRVLAPAHDLLRPPGQPRPASPAGRPRVALPSPRLVPRPPATGGIAGPSAAAVQADVARYSGAAPLDAAGAIASRHVRHPHAERAVQALIADLQAMGHAAHTHTFWYGGRQLSNVFADVPGTGGGPIPAAALERLRAAARSPGNGAPDLLPALAGALGHDWVRGEHLDAVPPPRLAAEVERRLGLGGWIPWWAGDQPLPGFGAELVIVGCHLDSTAAASPRYDPATSPAPGADDDASGMACVLAVARELARLRGTLAHTVRLCFFNAEAQGLVGSASYAAHLKAAGAPVKAVICVDMAGYDAAGERRFEIHAGATDPGVRDASAAVAEAVARWAASLTTLAPAQIHRGTSAGPGANRDVYDPAIGRADHASFQEQGYPAVVISEDCFVNQPGEEGAEPNPAYHRLTDTAVDAPYLADIARAVTWAAVELARGPALNGR